MQKQKLLQIWWENPLHYFGTCVIITLILQGGGTTAPSATGKRIMDEAQGRRKMKTKVMAALLLLLTMQFAGASASAKEQAGPATPNCNFSDVDSLSAALYSNLCS